MGWIIMWRVYFLWGRGKKEAWKEGGRSFNGERVRTKDTKDRLKRTHQKANHIDA
jgi:hypothetical protein